MLRGFEILASEDACKQCNLKRSNAMYRPKTRHSKYINNNRVNKLKMMSTSHLNDPEIKRRLVRGKKNQLLENLRVVNCCKNIQFYH